MRKNINLELHAALRTVCQPNSKIFIVVYLANFHKINICRLMMCIFLYWSTRLPLINVVDNKRYPRHYSIL